MATVTYSPKDVVITYAGRILTGLVEDSFVEVSRDTDSFSDEVGADGEVVRTLSSDQRGIIRVVLQQTSMSNDVLASLVAAGEQRLGPDVHPVQVKHIRGASLYGGAEAWVRKPTDATFANAPEGRTWEIRVAKLQTFTGGQPA